MTDRSSKQDEAQDRTNTGAGSRQQEQQTAGGAMKGESEKRSEQSEQHGGTYHPEGDRGVEFEPGEGDQIRMEGQQEQGERADRRQERGGDNR